MKIILLLISLSAFGAPYSTKSSLSYMTKTAAITNCVLKNEKFLSEVASFPKYTYTTKTPQEVRKSLESMKPVIISTYRTKNPWSKAIATTYSSDKTTVYFNTRKNPRPMTEMVNTSIHEGLHLNGFSHGSNSPVGKEDSVNYRVGTIGEKYVSECEK
jgi:hypothetical protein